jgi:hypothetical protein
MKQSRDAARTRKIELIRKCAHVNSPAKMFAEFDKRGISLTKHFISRIPNKGECQDIEPLLKKLRAQVPRYKASKSRKKATIWGQ